MRDPGKLIKAEKWWNDKTPPVLGIAYFLLSAGGVVVPLDRSLVALLAFITAFIGVAGFGHVINDLYDVANDRIAGKHNAMQGNTRFQTTMILLALLAVAWLPWLILPANRWNLLLLGSELLLLTMYSVPPLRLKVRALAGVIADALYAYTIPLLITWTTWEKMGGPTTHRPLLLATLIPWSLFAGLRGILYHQYLDAENDHASGANTFATRYGRQRTLWVLAHLVLPAEIGFFALMTVAFGRELWFYPVGVVLFLCWRTFQIAYSRDAPCVVPWRPPEDFVTLCGYGFLGEFYTAWFPLFMLVALSRRSPVYLALAFTHLALFKTGLWSLFRYDFRYIPAGISWMRRRLV